MISDLEKNIINLSEVKSLDAIVKIMHDSLYIINKDKMVYRIGIARLKEDELWKGIINTDTGKPYTSFFQYVKSDYLPPELRFEGSRQRLIEYVAEGEALLLLYKSRIIDWNTFNPNKLWTKLRIFNQAVERYGDVQAVFNKMMASTKNEFIEYATGEKASDRPETHKINIWQRYYLNYPLEKKEATSVKGK